MIDVTIMPNGSMIVVLDTPERVILAEVAVGYSIPKKEAMVAIINRGMDSIAKTLKDEAAKVTAKREAGDSDSGGD